MELFLRYYTCLRGIHSDNLRFTWKLNGAIQFTVPNKCTALNKYEY